MMKILFEDSDIIVCVKPRGLLSQADEKQENMINLLQNMCGSTVFPLHRLDREVGGVMVYAKNKVAAARLSCDIAENRFKKEYIALVHGVPETKNGEMQDLLFKDSSKNKSFVVKRERKGVKKASLEYELLNTVDTENGPLSVVRVLLHTGRTHQIRVQFSFRKMPLAGDKKYGARDEFSNIALWSYRITFNHPKTGEVLCFAEDPDEIIAEYL